MPGVSRQKAKKILADGKVRGKPLTPAQKRYFQAVAGGSVDESDVKEAVKQAVS